MRIDRAELRIGAQLGAGAQGTIHVVESLGAATFPFPVILKEFNATTTVSAAALEQLAQWRTGLRTDERDLLDAGSVWPCAVVTDRGRVSGYLMQTIPQRFMQLIVTSGSAHEHIPREIQHLFVADALARRNLGEVADPVDRLVLARGMAVLFGFLHKRNFIFGDLSYRNAVYTLRPTPGIMLLDCDGVRRRGQAPAVAQLNSPGWAAPEGGPQTVASDRYKLGLFILRVLTPGTNAQNRDPEKAAAVLDGEGMALLRRALGDDRSLRPNGREWVDHLDRLIFVAGGVKARQGPAPLPAAPPRVERPAARALDRLPAPPAQPHVPAGVFRHWSPTPGPAPYGYLPPPPNPYSRYGGWRPPPPATASGFGSPPPGHRPPTLSARPLGPAPWPPFQPVSPPRSSALSPDAPWWIVPVVLISLIGLFAVSLVVTAAVSNNSTGSAPITSIYRRPTSITMTAFEPVAIDARAAVAQAVAALPDGGDGWTVIRLASRFMDAPAGSTTDPLLTASPSWFVAAMPASRRVADLRGIVVFNGQTEPWDPRYLYDADEVLTSLPDYWSTTMASALATASSYRRPQHFAYDFECRVPVGDLPSCAWRFSVRYDDPQWQRMIMDETGEVIIWMWDREAPDFTSTTTSTR